MFLKSEPVKYHFIGMLLRNIRRALSAHSLSAHYRLPGAAYSSSVISRKKLQGSFPRIRVVDVSICNRTGSSPKTSLLLQSLSLPASFTGMSFAVRARRQLKRGVTSQELGTLIGSAIYDRIPGLMVDLDCPDYEIFVEVRNFGGLVYDSRIRELPVGCHGGRRAGSSSSCPRALTPLSPRGLR